MLADPRNPQPRPADEKSTFERLSASLVLNRQPLLQPKKLPSLNPLDFQVRYVKYRGARHKGSSKGRPNDRVGPTWIGETPVRLSKACPTPVPATLVCESVPLQPTSQPTDTSRLFQPSKQPPTSGRQVIRDHLEVFERNGFSFAEAAPDGGTFRPLRARGGAGEGPGPGEGEGPDCGEGGGDLLLTSVPYSKGVQFGPEEVAELVEAVASGEGRREAVRPSK